MNDYLDNICKIDRLIRHPKLVAAAITFSVTAMERKMLADIADDASKAEGYPRLDAYQEPI